MLKRLVNWVRRLIWGPLLIETNPYLRDPELRRMFAEQAVQEHRDLRQHE